MKSNLEYEWDLERNSREIVRLLLIYQLFEYIKTKNPQLLKTQFFGYMGPKRGFEAPQNPFHCAHPGQARAVTPDGDVYTCHRAIYNFDTCIIGHIDENGNYTHNADNLKNYMNVKPCNKCQGCESAYSAFWRAL